MKPVKFLIGEAEAELTEKVEGHFSDAEWELLGRFNEFVEELIAESSLAREGIPAELNISWNRETGLKTTTRLPDWSDVIVLLHRLRPLILQSEPTFFSKIKNIIAGSIDHALVRSNLKHLGREFSGVNLQAIATVYASAAEHEDFYLVNSERVLQDWLNGFEYHRDQVKREFIESLHRFVPLESSKVLFLLMLAEKVKAIVTLRNIISVLTGESTKALYQVTPQEPVYHRVFLLPVITSISYLDDVAEGTPPPRGIRAVFYPRPATQGIGNLFDGIEYIWNRWLEGSISPQLGATHLFLEVPNGFKPTPNDQGAKNAVLIVSMGISAVVLTYQGSIKTRPTKHPDSGEVLLELDDSSIRKVSSTTISDSKDFKTFVDETRRSGDRIERILKVPRIMFRSCYWPPTTRAVEKVSAMRHSGVEPTFELVEGNDLSRAWEIFSERGIRPEDYQIILTVELDDLKP